MRSFGIVKLAFATEIADQQARRQLGMSPIEIRRINAVETGTKTVTGQILHAVGFKKTLDAIEPIYEARRRAIAAEPQRPGIRRGLGLASLGYGIGYSGVRNPSTARVEVTPKTARHRQLRHAGHRARLRYDARADRRRRGGRQHRTHSRRERRLDQDR